MINYYGTAVNNRCYYSHKCYTFHITSYLGSISTLKMLPLERKCIGKITIR